MKLLFLISEFFYYERLGFLYAATPLKMNGYKVKVVRPQSHSFDKLSKEISNYQPDIIGYSISTGEHNYYINLNWKLKQNFTFFSIFGGPHPTFFSEMINEEGVDGVCVGEAEDALLEFAEKFHRKENIYNIANFWIKKEDKIIKNPPRDVIMDLDQISFPDRSIIYDCDDKLRNFNNKIFFASRGCPKKCTYCYNHLYQKIYPAGGLKVRIRSVTNLIDEILDVQEKYPLKFISFGDDNFPFKPKGWLEEFGELYTDKLNLPYQISVSANFINHQMLSILKKSNCYSINMSLECGDEEINNRLLKKGISKGKFVEAVALAKEYGIIVRSLNILSLPVPDPIEVDLHTLDVNIQCKPDAVLATPLTPFPKLEITEYCINNRYLKDKNIIYQLKTNTNERSILNYGNKNINRKAARLRMLFGITVEFPFLRPFIKFLINLPLYQIYKYINILWFGYVVQIRLANNVSFFKVFSMLPSFMKYLIYREKY